MELWSTISRIVYLEALLGTSNFILEIFSISLLFSTIGWNSLTLFDQISLNCSTTRDIIWYALMISIAEPCSCVDKPFVLSYMQQVWKNIMKPKFCNYFNSPDASISYQNDFLDHHYQKQPFRGVLRKKCSKNMEQIYRRTPMPKSDFNKVTKHFYWNYTSAWVFSCKFTAYFQNNFSQQHFWRAASALRWFKTVNKRFE